MSWLRILSLTLLLGFGAVGLAACDDGPGENLGERVDETIEGAGDAVSPPGPAERAGEAADEAAEGAGEALEGAGERMQQ